MAVKIRLQRKGRKKAPFYHLVVADARSPRDGRFIEKIGTYNPLTRPATIDVDRDKAFDWLMKGAQPTDTARAILRFKGVYYRKHLALGVGKGALTQEEADTRYNAWVDEKEAKIAARFVKTAEEKAAFHAAVSGQAKPKKAAPAPAAVVVETATEAVEAVAETVEAVVETAPETVEAVAETVEAVVETATEAVAEAAEETAEAEAEVVEEAAAEEEKETSTEA
ncbi:MAG: 30S ribosomal protein S16 [Saprospiraceae bacterium]|nr:30S ribosomal protein S16 [Saprospiraceae bacterium]